MQRRALIVALIAACFLSASVAATPTGYNPVLVPKSSGNTKITWTVLNSSNDAFALYWSGTGAWLAENGSEMIFEITGVEEDVEGTLTLGNKTWSSNDTEIAMDLTLSVWSLSNPWLPGFIVKIGESNLDQLNSTALAAAARVSGNYMNGTMTSSYEQVVAGGMEYDCIVFDYVQDPPLFGEPQLTSLSYDVETGVLVRAKTSYSFGTPYILILELSSISPSADFEFWLAALALTVGGILAVVIVAVLRRK
ncbi:MAG: hypothetical protein JSW05_13240 [Candidatus Thorarchaeota archaeon]|nr:MAG: hypothetical protein JSW05_13240 [Candidatus Thorarchaeota archaeon]